jgi:nucleoside 2-deoxyribosyltransferase
MKKVYVAHPYGGEENNKLKVEKIIKNLVENEPANLYISPIHITGFYYNDFPYEQGMEYCFELLRMCDELLLCGDWKKSTGCCMEYGYAKAMGKKIKFFDK